MPHKNDKTEETARRSRSSSSRDVTMTDASDVGTLLYAFALLILVCVVDSAFAQQGLRTLVETLAGPTVATLYLWKVVVILAGYAPPVAVLHVKHGGRVALFVGAVWTAVLVGAPLEAFYRVETVGWAGLRSLVFGTACVLWILSFARQLIDVYLVIGLLVASAISSAVSRPTGLQLALQAAALVAAHVRLVRPLSLEPGNETAKPVAATPATCGTWAGRIALVLVAPALAIGLAMPVQTTGYALGELLHVPTNHAGVPFCNSTREVAYPHTVEELQTLVRTNRRITAYGAGHSWSPLICGHPDALMVKTELLRQLVYDAGTQTITVGGGATFGSVQNRLLKQGRMLASSWHAQVCALSRTAPHVPPR